MPDRTPFIPRMPRHVLLIASLITLLLATGWLVWNVEWIEEQSDPFFSDAAIENPYLAAQLFLERLHYAVTENEDEEALERLPDGKVVILLISGRAHLSEQRQNDLLKWISNGGHLITLANREWNEKTESIDDLLQRQFDVAAVRTSNNSMELVNLLFEESSGDSGETNDDEPTPANRINDNAEKGAGGATAESTAADATDTHVIDNPDDADAEFADDDIAGVDEQCPAETPLGTTSIEWLDGQALIADIGGKMRIEIGDVEPTLSAADALGLQFVQFRYGFGKVTFLSSMALWSNHKIGSFDNAHLLALLAGDAERIIILHDFDAIPLTELLKHFFPATLIMLAILIAMIIFHFQQRWGSILNTQAPPRRSLHEHIAASGRLLWRNRQIAPMIRRQQQLIVEQIARTQHQAPLTVNETQKLMAQKTGIALEQIRIALREPATAQDELLEQIRLLQSIRNSL